MMDGIKNKFITKLRSLANVEHSVVTDGKKCHLCDYFGYNCYPLCIEYWEYVYQSNIDNIRVGCGINGYDKLCRLCKKK